MLFAYKKFQQNEADRPDKKKKMLMVVFIHEVSVYHFTATALCTATLHGKIIRHSARPFLLLLNSGLYIYNHIISKYLYQWNATISEISVR